MDINRFLMESSSGAFVFKLHLTTVDLIRAFQRFFKVKKIKYVLLCK